MDNTKDSQPPAVAKDVVDALRAVMHELWWCAKQLGADIEDEKWLRDSSVGRALTGGRTALSTISLPPTQAEVERCNRCGWPIVAEGEAGCWESNCSMRPLPPLRTHPAPKQEEVERLLAASGMMNRAFLNLAEREKFMNPQVEASIRLMRGLHKQIHDGLTAMQLTGGASDEAAELLGTWKTEITARMQFKALQREISGSIYTEGAARADEADGALIKRIDALLPTPPNGGSDE